jgi:glycosyltransferase involved in cell wall biosynthesis
MGGNRRGVKRHTASVEDFHVAKRASLGSIALAGSTAPAETEPSVLGPRPTVSVVIPALNEAESLPRVLESIPADVHEVLLVDGRSEDGTCEVARQTHPGIVVVEQPGYGKGDALRAGFAAATGDIIVAMDADGSTDPREIPAFIGALCAGADFAKGSRFLHGAGTSDMSLHRRLGNLGFVLLVRALYGGRYSDLCYGYNAFWRDVLPKLELDRDGFEIEALMNIRALKANLKVVEVASFEGSRLMGIAKLRTFRDGWRVLKTILDEQRRVPEPRAAPGSASFPECRTGNPEGESDAALAEARRSASARRGRG